MKILALKFEVQHIRGTQNIIAVTLSRMFESSSPEVPNLAACNLALTTFPLAFQELGQLHREDSLLPDIIAKPERGDEVDNYSLFKGTLYCRCRKGRGQSLWFLPPNY